jgi:phosphopantetheinyl transferase
LKHSNGKPSEMPLLFSNQINSSIRIAVWKITEGEKELLKMLPSLEKTEKDFLNKISFIPRKLEWLASRVLIYQLTGLYPATRYNNNGQPFLNNGRENLSISHTKGYAAISLSIQYVPGIDLEYPSPRIEKVSERFLNTKEKMFITKQEKENQLAIIWCTKEAIYKRAGIPDLSFKDQIIVDPFLPNSSKGKFSATLITNGIEKKIEMEYIIDKSFYLAYTR